MKDIYRVMNDLIYLLRDSTVDKINNNIPIVKEHVPFDYLIWCTDDGLPFKYSSLKVTLPIVADYIETNIDKWYMDVIRLGVIDGEDDDYILDFWWIE